MKVTILQENLARGLATVSKAVSPRSTLPVLANILIASDEGRLRLSATNLEMGITCWIAARTGDEPRGAAVPPSYYAGLEFEDGSRDEFLVDGALVTRVRGGEIGAAFVRDGVLLDFRRAR